MSDDSTLSSIENYATWAATVFDRNGLGPLVTVYETRGWIVNDDGSLSEGVDRQFFAMRLAEVLRSDTIGRPLHLAACKAIESDPRFSAYLGGMVGTEMAQSPVSSQQIVDTCVLAQLNEDTGEFVHNLPKVQEVFHQISEIYTEATLPATLLIPLINCSLPKGCNEFQISDDVMVVRFTDAEYVTLAKFGVIVPNHYSFSHIGAEWRVGLRVNIPVGLRREIFNGPLELPAAPAAQRLFGDRSSIAGFPDLVEDLMFCLRLVMPGRLLFSGACLSSPVRPLLGHSVQSYRKQLPFHVAAHSRIERRHLVKVSEQWALLASDADGRFPRICARRFNTSAERHGTEDGIVDMMIVAEALFLSDRSNDQNELSYRLRLRGARFLRSKRYPMISTMKLLKQAYILRSQIVHGVHEPLNRGKPGTIDILKFSDELYEFMRNALVKASRESANDNFGTQAYWDRLLLGE